MNKETLRVMLQQQEQAKLQDERAGDSTEQSFGGDTSFTDSQGN